MPKNSNDAVTLDTLDSMEARLAGTLKPVSPSRVFVNDLRSRIHLPKPREIVTRLRDWHLIVIVIGVVTSATLVIATIARALYTLFDSNTEDSDAL